MKQSNPTGFTKELIAQHSLTADEYKKIAEVFGRELILTDLSIFPIM
ncbi:hypothetical protein [Petrachloros mirabilis]